MKKNKGAMRGRKVLLAGGLAVTALCLGACGSRSKDRTADIKKSGQLKVAIEEGPSRMTWIDNGEYKGMEPELARQIANAFSVQVQFIPIDENRTALDYIDSGEADMAIGSIVDNGSLGNDYGVTTPYANGYLYAVTSRGNFCNSLAALADCPVGISPELSETLQQSIAQIRTSDKKTYESRSAGWKDLENGVIQAYLCGEDEAEDMIDSDTAFQAQNLTDAQTEGYVIATAKNNQDLLEGMEAVEQAYLELVSNGKQESTTEK